MVFDDLDESPCNKAPVDPCSFEPPATDFYWTEVNRMVAAPKERLRLVNKQHEIEMAALSAAMQRFSDMAARVIFDYEQMFTLSALDDYDNDFDDLLPRDTLSLGNPATAPHAEMRPPPPLVFGEPGRFSPDETLDDPRLPKTSAVSCPSLMHFAPAIRSRRTLNALLECSLPAHFCPRLPQRTSTISGTADCIQPLKLFPQCPPPNQC